MSIVMMAVVLAAILIISEQVKKRKKKATEQSEKIVGYTPALQERNPGKQKKTDKPMATPVGPQLSPVFLKEEDWSAYDTPAFLRKKKEAEATRQEQQKAPAQKTLRGKTPKQSMAAHRAQKSGGQPQKAPTKASYEEI